MRKGSLFVAVVGLIINVLGIVLLAVIVWKYRCDYDKAQLFPGIRHKYCQELLHNVYYRVLGVAGAIMATSVVAFWYIRQRPDSRRR